MDCQYKLREIQHFCMFKQFVVETWNIFTFLGHSPRIALSSDEVQLQIQRDLPLHQPIWTPGVRSCAKLGLKHSPLAGYGTYHLIQMIFNCHIAAHWSRKTWRSALICHCVRHKALLLQFVTIQIWYQVSFLFSSKRLMSLGTKAAWAPAWPAAQTIIICSCPSILQHRGFPQVNPFCKPLFSFRFQ